MCCKLFSLSASTGSVTTRKNFNLRLLGFRTAIFLLPGFPRTFFSASSTPTWVRQSISRIPGVTFQSSFRTLPISPTIWVTSSTKICFEMPLILMRWSPFLLGHLPLEYEWRQAQPPRKASPECQRMSWLLLFVPILSTLSHYFSCFFSGFRRFGRKYFLLLLRFPSNHLWTFWVGISSLC